MGGLRAPCGDVRERGLLNGLVLPGGLRRGTTEHDWAVLHGLRAGRERRLLHRGQERRGAARVGRKLLGQGAAQGGTGGETGQLSDAAWGTEALIVEYAPQYVGSTREHGGLRAEPSACACVR